MISKEEFGANAAAIVYAVVVAVAIATGASISEAAIRGGLCAAGSSLLGQFLGGMTARALSTPEKKDGSEP